MTETLQVVSPARRLGGRIVLTGMVSLFIGLILLLIGMFLLYRMSNPIGNSFLTGGKLFAGLWLPLVLLGAVLRIVNPATPESSQANVGSESSQ